MKQGLRNLSLALALSGCSAGSLVPSGMADDWKCGVRDSNGNPFFGFDRDRARAADKALWQCVSGSPYKDSCKAELARCDRLE